MLLALHVDDTGIAVGLARVVDKSRRVAMHGCIDYVKVVDTEHVAANSLVMMKNRDHLYVQKRGN